MLLMLLVFLQISFNLCFNHLKNTDIHPSMYVQHSHSQSLSTNVVYWPCSFL